MYKRYIDDGTGTTSVRHSQFLDFNKFVQNFHPAVKSRDFPGGDVSLGSQCGCHLRFFSKLCMRVVDKKVNCAGLLCCREL